MVAKFRSKRLSLTEVANLNTCIQASTRATVTIIRDKSQKIVPHPKNSKENFVAQAILYGPKFETENHAHPPKHPPSIVVLIYSP